MRGKEQPAAREEYAREKRTRLLGRLLRLLSFAPLAFLLFSVLPLFTLPLLLLLFAL